MSDSLLIFATSVIFGMLALINSHASKIDKKMDTTIKELQEQLFTKEEAEKIETFLIHGYQMMINENKKIFSKLEKMKGEL